jgi:hypothetical protein
MKLAGLIDTAGSDMLAGQRGMVAYSFGKNKDGVESANPTFALGWHFRLSRKKIPFAFNVGTAKNGENSLGEDLASFLRDRSLACCC